MKRLDMVFLNVTLPLTVNGHTARRAGKNGGPFERRRIAGVPVQFIFGMADCAMRRPPPESMVPNFQLRDAGENTIAVLPQWQRFAVLSPAPLDAIYPQADSTHIGALIIAEFHCACRRRNSVINAD